MLCNSKEETGYIMKVIKVLDVTLRDGGCVNDFNFGHSNMERILDAQEKSGVDIIEIGYLDEKNGSTFGRTQYANEKVIPETILKLKKPGITYVAMVDYGKYDPDKLGKRTENGIDGIRLAFHKKNQDDIVDFGKKVMDKGYQFYVQPMITLRYTDSELLALIDVVNHKLPEASGFYIVDSFGEMRPNDMGRILNLVDHNLTQYMSLGYHSHNNLQMSYSNAVALLQFPTNRDILLDASIMGMGKGAGNLNTELLLEHLNLFYGKSYNVSPLLEVMDKVINQIRSEFYWGYSPEYYLSSANHCTPSYASHFYNKHMLPIDQVSELLRLIDEDKKISFDRDYAEKLYHDYNAKKTVNDGDDVKDLLNELKGKSLFLIAPGKSISGYREKISEYVGRDSIVTISLNLSDDFDQDYILVTKQEALEEANKTNKKMIVMSSVAKDVKDNVKVLNYKDWTEWDEKVRDSSSVAAFLLAERAGVSNVYLAGFDGFSVNINDNYYDANMRVPMLSCQVDERNRYYTKRLKQMKNKGINVIFVTPSKYGDYKIK